MKNAAHKLNNYHVKEIMSKNVVSISPDTILTDLDGFFEKHKVHHLPVVAEDGKLVGIVSHADILLLKEWGSDGKIKGINARNNILMRSNLVSDIMTPNPVTVKPEDTIGTCVELLLENNYKSLPVVNEEGILKGIITTYDLLLLAYTDFHQALII
ncbi:MAG TPA: CBS domain-containing protein [Saprospiraceae bacterium]|nr:CBS domain-containing protein [Saprospiraceae bacterium]